jgi:hypothetical protein
LRDAISKPDYTSSPVSPVKAQDIQLMSEGKVAGMLGKARNLTLKARYPEAKALLEECLSFPQQVLGLEHAFYVELQELEVENRIATAEYGDVNELLVGVLNSKIDLYGPDSVQLVHTMVMLADFYRAQAKYDDASTFYTQVLSYDLHLIDISLIPFQFLSHCFLVTTAPRLFFFPSILSSSDMPSFCSSVAIVSHSLCSGFAITLQSLCDCFAIA